jgi:hypothetical protein
MARVNFVILGFLLILTACTERLVCPAYQSAYIYDKNELRKKFSYFLEDSTPKILTASKNKYLVAEATPYRKKIRSLQTVPMKKVMVNVPDSISGKGTQDSVITADLDKAARSVMDTTMIVDVPPADSVTSEEDSTYMITKDKEVRILKYNMPDSLEYDAVANKYVPQKPAYYVDEVGYNTEQDNYMWYLRRSLILPDVRIAKMQQAEGKEGGKSEKKGQKGIRGFFKNLFKKKKTEDIDSAELEIQPQEEEFDFIDTTATMGPIDPEEVKKRKNEVSDTDEGDTVGEPPAEADKPAKKKKKKKKSDDKIKEEQPDTEQKKEEEDDGF